MGSMIAGDILYKCSKAHECGRQHCPHAKKHAPYQIGDKVCTDPLPCLWLADFVCGVGKVRAVCRCEEVEDNERNGFFW